MNDLRILVVWILLTAVIGVLVEVEVILALDGLLDVGVVDEAPLSARVVENHRGLFVPGRIPPPDILAVMEGVDFILVAMVMVVVDFILVVMVVVDFPQRVMEALSEGEVQRLPRKAIPVV